MNNNELLDQSTKQIPDKIKLDLDTPLETLFNVLSVIGALSTIALIINIFYELEYYLRHNEILTRIVYILISGGLTYVFIKCRLSTNNYYIVDNVKKSIVYNYEFFGNKKLEQVANFEDIKYVAIGGTRYEGKRKAIWLYYMYLITKDGNMITVSNAIDESEIAENNKKVARLALIIGCEFIEGVAEKVLKVEKNSIGDLIVKQVNYDEAPLHISTKIQNTLQVTMVIIGIIALIVIIVIAFYMFLT